MTLGAGTSLDACYLHDTQSPSKNLELWRYVAVRFF